MRYLFILLGYFISVFVAVPFTFGWSWLLHKLLRGDQPKETQPPVVAWIPVFIGILERAVITTLVGWGIAGEGMFIVGWLALKSVADWQSLRSPETLARTRFFVGLLGSLLSLLFGLAGGLIIYNLGLNSE